MKNKNLYAVILAGGSGTRFWPMSRKDKPKQFLNITGQGSLLQSTLKRLQKSISPVNVLIVTNKEYKSVVAEQIKAFKVPVENILLEPEGKNTAPAICWAAACIHQRNPEAVMGVFPSDHLILNQTKFEEILQRAIKLAEQEYLVTFGIVPTRPETGYGYLKTIRDKGIVHVAQFIEKPILPKAKRYYKNKNYFWNSGMFVWRTETILKAFEIHLPDIHKVFVGKGVKPASTPYINKVWPKLQNISIDYGILEDAQDVAAIPSRGLEWSDVGSWEALSEVLDKDKDNNILKGDVLSIKGRNNLVWGSDKIIATIGLDNIVVIDTPDALLVCRKDMSQSVKVVVDTLKKNKVLSQLT
ncbi:Mannose-1-phosphate guanylyltransferase [hydrothermal vent metagenome]|uniref:Mannose-1-phosphate guanylyltransferase n=1 Tax=hydrothermal vent metagenome TaxID=652676 RepID=A0A3B1DZG7_9ZZZZ